MKKVLEELFTKAMVETNDNTENTKTQVQEESPIDIADVD
jgi:hypothetical protein